MMLTIIPDQAFIFLSAMIIQATAAGEDGTGITDGTATIAGIAGVIHLLPIITRITAGVRQIITGVDITDIILIRITTTTTTIPVLHQ